MDPRVVPPAQNEAINTAAAAFLDAMEAQAIGLYGPEEMTRMGPKGRLACVFMLATQALLSPEAVHAVQIDVDTAARGIGIGFGARCAVAGFSEGQMAQAIQHLLNGFSTGRTDHEAAAAAMITQGSA